MTTVRSLTYETKNNYQDVFTRIRLDVERVATLVNPLLGNITADTTKPWVGKINSNEGTFKVVQTNSSILPLRFLEGNFFTIFIHGVVWVDEDKTRIDVRLKLGWYSALTLLLFYLLPIMATFNIINQNDWNSLKGLALWFLIFDAIPTLLLILQLNRIENSMSDLLGVD